MQPLNHENQDAPAVRPAASEYKILIVDDSPIILLDFRMQLSEKFAKDNILTASSVPEAKVILSENDISLAVVDMQLPEWNGADLISDMKASERWKNIPVIVVTGTKSGGILEIGFRKHVQAYLYKPLERGKLLAITEKLLNS